MPRVFNADTIEYEEKRSPVPEFCWHTSAALSDLIGAGQLDFFIRSLDPGAYSYPYHFHRNSEELFVILSGSAKLRTQEGVRELKAGDIAFFERGPSGAHQLFNHAAEPCRYLDLGAMTEFDVCEYPDSGKINILPERDIFYRGDRAEYCAGEAGVAAAWAKAESGGAPA